MCFPWLLKTRVRYKNNKIKIKNSKDFTTELDKMTTFSKSSTSFLYNIWFYIFQEKIHHAYCHNVKKNSQHILEWNFLNYEKQIRSIYRQKKSALKSNKNISNIQFNQ